MPARMPPGDQATLERLLKVAAGRSGQSEKVAGFLLAWWNAQSCGGFDLTVLWQIDAQLSRDCCLLMGWISQNHHYPDELGFAPQFEALVRQWRPTLT